MKRPRSPKAILEALTLLLSSDDDQGDDEDEIRIERGVFASALEMADPAAGADGLVAGKPIQLVPVGTFHHPKHGRFAITRSHLERMTANAVGTGMDLLVDWEHKSSKDSAPVSERRAAGWIDPKTLSVVDGWLMGTPKWTLEAARAIAAKAFRWISPEFVFDRLNKATGGRQGATILAAGLTNRPFLPAQAGVSLSEGWAFEEARDDHAEGDDAMKWWEKLAAKLGLGEDATEDEVVTKLTEKLGDDGENDDGDQGEQLPDAVAKQLTDKGWDGEQDPAEFLEGLEKKPAKGTVTLSEEAVTKLQVDAAAGVRAEKALKLRDAQDAVAAGMREGKIAPAQEEFFQAMALADPKQLEKFLETAPVVVELGERGGAGGGDEPDDSLEAVQKEIDDLVTKKLAAANTGDEITLTDGDAYHAVLSENPALHRRLLAAAGKATDEEAAELEVVGS